MSFLSTNKLLKVNEISQAKDIKLKPVHQEFLDAKIYLREQLVQESSTEDFSESHWQRTLAIANEDIGPKGALRK